MTKEEIGIEIEFIRELNRTSKFSEAIEKAEKLLNFPEVLDDKSKQSNLYNSLLVSHLFLSEFSKAIEFGSKAIELNTEIDNLEGLANNYLNLGSIFSELSEYTRALEYFEKSLSINEKIGKLSSVANCLGSIGNVFLTLKNYSKSIEYLLKSYELSASINNMYGMAISLGNLGTIYFNLNKAEQAQEYFLQSLQINKEISNKKGIAIELHRLAIIQTNQNQYSEALSTFQEAISINLEIESKHSLSENYLHLGNLHYQLLDYNKAIEYITSSIDLSEKIGNKINLTECYIIISNVYESLKDFQNSFKYIKLYNETKEGILSEEASKNSLRFDQRRKIEEDEKARQLKLARFQEQEKILNNILPENIAERILNQEIFIADHFQSVSVLFLDLVGFTVLATLAPPKQLVYLLDTIFTKADEVVESFGLEKIKTIGDGYLAVANVTTPLEDHQKATAMAALELLQTMKDFNVAMPTELGETTWTKDLKDIEIRIGIHTGEVVAGIIGKNKYTYDLWGDAVNVASRMESNSEPGRIHVSDEFAKSIENNAEFSFIPRGEILIKGKGTMKTFWLEKTV